MTWVTFRPITRKLEQEILQRSPGRMTWVTYEQMGCPTRRAIPSTEPRPDDLGDRAQE